MKVLFFGDVFGRPGREVIRQVLPDLAETHQPDFIVANVENIAHGAGITSSTLSELDELGVFDAYTAGNHLFSNPGAQQVLENPRIPLVRPINFAGIAEGSGARVITKGAKRLLVVNAIGKVFMKEEGEQAGNPLQALDELLNHYTLDVEEDGKERVDGILVDFHAEATAEKRLMGFFLDGRVSAVVGTHTHVPTRDEQILPKGTAYISDVGMVGPFNSSLGLLPEPLIDEMLTGIRQKRDVADDRHVEVGAVVVTLNEVGLATHIEHIRKIVEREGF